MSAVMGKIRNVLFPRQTSGIPVGVFVIIVTALVLVAIFAPLLAPEGPNSQNLMG